MPPRPAPPSFLQQICVAYWRMTFKSWCDIPFKSHWYLNFLRFTKHLLILVARFCIKQGCALLMDEWMNEWSTLLLMWKVMIPPPPLITELSFVVRPNPCGLTKKPLFYFTNKNAFQLKQSTFGIYNWKGRMSVSFDMKIIVFFSFIWNMLRSFFLFLQTVSKHRCENH